MWWRRCKTAHKLVTTFANCFVTLATSCKMLEVLVDFFTFFSLVKRRKNEQNKCIVIISKLPYSVLCYCKIKLFKQIKLYCL